MISHLYQCIFVHQRKCAGSSIRTAFGIEPDSFEWNFLNDGVLSPEWPEHPHHFGHYFKFAVVRNPWERFVSGWKYLAAIRDLPILEVLRNLPAEGHDYRHITRPQFITLYDAAGNLAIDQLLRFENLEQDFQDVCKRIGLKTQLPWVNAGTHTPPGSRQPDHARSPQSYRNFSMMNRWRCLRKNMERISSDLATHFNHCQQ